MNLGWTLKCSIRARAAQSILSSVPSTGPGLSRKAKQPLATVKTHERISVSGRECKVLTDDLGNLSLTIGCCHWYHYLHYLISAYLRYVQSITMPFLWIIHVVVYSPSVPKLWSLKVPHVTYFSQHQELVHMWNIITVSILAYTTHRDSKSNHLYIWRSTSFNV